MQISLNIIMDVLKSFQLENHFSVDGRAIFSKCLPLPDDAGDIESDCIYIDNLSKAMFFTGRAASFHCICLRDRIKDSAEIDTALNGLIIVNENISLSQLFTVVQKRFFTVFDWVQKMHETVIHDGSMQDILDLCEPILDNHISVSDSSLMIMAYTRHIACDDPICVSLAKYGYHPEETIQLFRKFDLFNIWASADALYVDETCSVAKYVTVHKVFKFGNMYFAHVVMSCNNHHLTPCLTDLFQIFIDVLAVYVERAWEAKNACNHIYDTFLTDLIDGNIVSKSVIKERAQYVGIPTSGQFCLFQVVPNDSVNMSIGKMLLEFADTFPKFKFIRYQQHIVAINHFSARYIDDQLKSICETMEAYLEKYDALCGVSLIFTSLEELPFAFKQATLALKYVSRLRGSETFRNVSFSGSAQSRIHYYNQKYLFCLLGEYDENIELWFHSEYHRLLKKLHHHDQRHKSNNLQLLHVFLNCERNATEAASALNMHRNNVTYHISRIQELLEIDLNDPSVRLLLLVSFILLELYGFDNP